MLSDVKLNASCHCGRASYSYILPSNAFPLKSALCHCYSCRHVTGHLFGTSAVIPSELPDLTPLTKYQSSPTLSRYFCPTCGASVINVDKDEWEFATGVLERTEGLLKRVQLFVEDTRDGGAAAWLSEAVPEAHLQHRDSKRIGTAEIKAIKAKEEGDDTVEARCHCGDVSFDIASSKYPAGLDACTSCRKVSGFEITSWVTVPKRSITMAGKPLDLQTLALKHYGTSNDVHRYFCNRCGATVFYLKDGRDTIDVGVGLLRAGGARAEKILVWEKYNDCVAYQDDATDGPFVRMLIEGISREK